MRKIIPFLCLFALLLSGCGTTGPFRTGTENLDVFTDTPEDDVSPTPIPETPPETPTETVPEAPINMDDYTYLASDGDTQYLWNNRGNDCVLYTLCPGDSAPRELVVLDSEEIYSSNTLDKNDILQFDFCGDWVFMCVGYYQGSGHYFFGSFASVKKGGGGLRYLYPTADDHFFVIDDWVYFNDWNLPEIGSGRVEGCYRIRPDGTGEEYMNISEILLYADDGYVYGAYDTDQKIAGNLVQDLRRCLPDGSGAVTLFEGSTLPCLDEGYYIGYYDITVEEEWVSFSVYVHGYSKGDGWRGHDLYQADCRVRKDGSELTLLEERYDCDP